MKKALILAGALSAAVIVAANGANAETRETYNFTGFHELDTAAGVEVIFETAPAYSVVADFRKGGPEDLKIHKEGDRLYISRKTTSGWGNNVRVTVHVTAPDLNAVETGSGSSVRASGIASDNFSVKVSSGGSVDIDGTCGLLTVRASSGGSADAKELKCERVTAQASSGGSARAYASSEATSRTSSGGSVDIWGNPSARETHDSISGGSTDFH